jgi:hypothetical protein
MANIDEMKFVYLKSDDDPLHRVTAIGVKEVNGVWEIQIARCHAPDNFCKRIARDIIRGRYKKHGAYKKYTKEICANRTELYEQLFFDFNPDSGNDLIPDSEFLLED